MFITLIIRHLTSCMSHTYSIHCSDKGINIKHLHTLQIIINVKTCNIDYSLLYSQMCVIDHFIGVQMFLHVHRSTCSQLFPACSASIDVAGVGKPQERWCSGKVGIKTLNREGKVLKLYPKWAIYLGGYRV